MRKIVWKTKNVVSGFSQYFTTIGSIEVFCTPEIRFSNNYDLTSGRVVGWEPAFWTGEQFIAGKMRKSLESAKIDAKKLATDYLVGIGASVLTQLKRAEVLEEAMSVAGID